MEWKACNKLARTRVVCAGALVSLGLGCTDAPPSAGTATAPAGMSKGGAPGVSTPVTIAANGGSSGAAPRAGGSGASAPAAPAGTQAPVASASGALPCDVEQIIAAKCQTCHGVEPIGGAPMPLTKASDFSAQMTSRTTLPGQNMSVTALVRTRIHDASKPMPPGALLPDNERALITAWLDRGAPQAAAGEATCNAPQPTQPAQPSEPPPNPDGTRCYTFRNHGQPVPGDTTPYTILPGEQYVSFYYTAPWKEASELVRWRTLYDNRKVLHHWLFYSTLGNSMDGSFLPSIGTHIGDAAQLIAGWAVGGNDVSMPEGVGLRLPAPGAGLMVEFHFYNTGVAPELDTSAIELCVVPAGSLEHTAGMTWLGTENFNGPLGMPPKVGSSFEGTCLPSRTGMNATDPIHIFTLWPHMHKHGRNMRSVINRADGRREEVFNKPFDFNFQITYPAEIDLYPGDTITSTCDFFNTSNAPVAFGPSSDQEMCYQFAFSYPAGALDNGIPSLVGATNTCW